MSKRLSETRAMIIGGGIAGPVAAMALQQAGLDPVIYEGYGAGSDGTGAFLTLAANGLAALDVIGAGDVVAGLGMETPRMNLLSVRGRHGATRELGGFAMDARTVSRSQLYAALRDEATRRGIPIEYGKRLDDATLATSGVRATFTDGTSADGDLLIGADGLRSRTRTIIDPQAPQARHIGLLNVAGYAHGLSLPGNPGEVSMIFGTRCFFGYFIHPDGDIWWFANPPAKREPSREELLAITESQWRNQLTELFAGDNGPMLDIIASTATILPGWNTHDFPSVPAWHNDRMVIIGDAVHATSPSSGQGASLAIEDGVELARCLRDLHDPAVAFAAFKRLRQKRVEKVVRHGKRSGSGKAAGPIAAWMRDLMLPMFTRQMATSTSLNWMYDHRIDWETRVGQSMLPLS